KGGWMDGRELTIEQLEALSRLPSLDVMHSQLVGLIAMPISGLARGLNALLSGIAIALGQIAESRGADGSAEAPAEEAAPEPEPEPETEAEAEAEAEAEDADAPNEGAAGQEPEQETSEPEG